MNEDAAKGLAEELVRSYQHDRFRTPLEVQAHLGQVRQVLTLVPEPTASLVLGRRDSDSPALAMVLAGDLLFHVIVEIRSVEEPPAVKVASQRLPADANVRLTTSQGPVSDEHHHWEFELAEDDTIVVEGAVALSSNPPTPDEREQFARALAAVLSWDTAEAPSRGAQFT